MEDTDEAPRCAYPHRDGVVELVNEFKRAGLEQVTAIPEVLTKDAAPAMRTAAAVLRQVVTAVVEQVAAKLALEPRDVRVHLVFAGR